MWRTMTSTTLIPSSCGSCHYAVPKPRALSVQLAASLVVTSSMEFILPKHHQTILRFYQVRISVAVSEKWGLKTELARCNLTANSTRALSFISDSTLERWPTYTHLNAQCNKFCGAMLLLIIVPVIYFQCIHALFAGVRRARPPPTVASLVPRLISRKTKFWRDSSPILTDTVYTVEVH